ncbi:MAG TPA: Asp23/Gls24 family envelope stress response protein [Clostridiaceae bacterium]|nr:Asp23/Gls24 family envelope stress response protein [Clostridiaceae bacterium]
MEGLPVEEITNEDKLKIAEEVIEIIASIEASKVPCVAAMSGGFTDGLAGILGKKNLGKGVRVETEENNVIVHISLIVEYGCKIHLVAREVQNVVRNAIQDMTGMNVTEVNVNIVGINIPKEIKDNKEVKEVKETKELKEKEPEEIEA